jgi:hypothetical protein
MLMAIREKLATALRLTQSVTYTNGTLHLAYDTVGVPS